MEDLLDLFKFGLSFEILLSAPFLDPYSRIKPSVKKYQVQRDHKLHEIL